jgi:hypothetical protein
LIWSIYCSKKQENARRLYEDAGRDTIGVFSAFAKWGAATAQAPDFLELFRNAKQDLSSRAAADGIESLDGPYRLVSEAAKECGIGDHFSVSYKVLSKFSHPTAMRILAPPDKGKTALQRDYFFSHGCLFFTGAFASLEGQLKQGMEQAT